MVQTFILTFIVMGVIVVSAYICNENIRRGGVSDRIFTDAFRGVAILMVILSHCADKLGTNVFTPLGGTGVAIFLILSGFGLSESYKKKGLNGFIAGKLIKIWLPFAIFILVVALLQENFDFKEILFSIFSVSPRQYWYVHHLLRCYFVFWIAYRFAYRYRWAININHLFYLHFCRYATNKCGAVFEFSFGNITFGEA